MTLPPPSATRCCWTRRTVRSRTCSTCVGASRRRVRS
jgi:hypothetical protein